MRTSKQLVARLVVVLAQAHAHPMAVWQGSAALQVGTVPAPLMKMKERKFLQ